MNSAFIKSLNYLDSMDQTFGTDSWPAVQQKYPKFEWLISWGGWNKLEQNKREKRKEKETLGTVRVLKKGRTIKKLGRRYSEEEEGKKNPLNSNRKKNRQGRKEENIQEVCCRNVQSEVKTVKMRKKKTQWGLKEGEQKGRGARKSEEKVTCWKRKERKRSSFSAVDVGSVLHKDFFVVVLLDKGLLPWERRQWHHLNWLSLCPPETKASSHPGGVRPGRWGGALCGCICVWCVAWVLSRVCTFVGT